MSIIISITALLIVVIISLMSGGALSFTPIAFRHCSVGVHLPPAPFTSSSSSSSTTVTPLPQHQHSRLHMSSDETNELLKKASLLRREAEALEETVRGTRDKDSKNISVETKMKGAPKKTYTSLKDSDWVISYRFASDDINRDDNEDDTTVKPIFYSGKVKISLSEDGYTNMLNMNSDSDNDSTKDSSSSVLTFEKFWGWDEEISSEDELQYVLFSADVLLPESDPNDGQPVRFYFQAQVDIDNNSNEITLSGGTVTLKKDIKPPGGFWGVFNGGGILAQFRYCGEFIMKPC